MKVERKILEDKILIILTNLNKTGEIKELIRSDLLNDYMNKTLLTKTLNLNFTLNNLNTYQLFHITRLINSYETKIKIEDYFTSEEINGAFDEKNNLKLEDTNLMKLDNVLYSKNINEESWVAIVTYRQIYEWMKTGKLIYNMATQRKGVMRKIGSDIVIMPYVNEKSVEDIKKQMLKGEFYSNMISFNVTPDFNHKIEYYSYERKLIIDTDIFEVAVIDGWHRCSAIVSAIEENPNLDGELYLKITNTSIEKAQNFIRQQSKVNAMDEEYFERYNPDNKITKFITDINEMGTEKTNPLYRKIDIDINTPNTWIVFDVFKEGLLLSGFIDKINETNSTGELKSMEKFIVEFFETFYGVAKDNNIKIEENETLTDPTFIMGLLITCYKYVNTRNIDSEAMDKFIKKFKNTTTQYTFDYPIKIKEKKIMINRFTNLLEV